MSNIDYVEPRIEIIEDDSSPAPVTQVSTNVIGVVGTFSKGAVNQKKTITSYDSLIRTFGDDKKGLTGCKSILAAMGQGAKNFVVVRIAGASAKEASLTLKDSSEKDSIVIKANSPGTWGNEILAASVNGTAANTFKLVIIYEGKSEVFDNLTLDNLSINSNEIVIEKAVGAAGIPKALSATPLSGGDDGSNVTDSDYVGTIVDGSRTGLKLMETEKVNIVLCAQQSSEAVRSALITHAANAVVRDGLRISILNPAKGLGVDAVSQLTQNLDNSRAVLGYPWNEYTDILGEFIAPDGFLAGILATGGAHESPSNRLVNGIVSQEVELTGGDIKTLTKARICPIAPDSGYRVSNGVTLSTNTKWNQISIRREFDEIEMDIYESTRWAKSKNITTKLMQSMADQIDAILKIKKDDEKIYDYKATICDETVNSPETMAARRLKTRVRIRPTYAADYIDHYIERYLGE